MNRRSFIQKAATAGVVGLAATNRSPVALAESEGNTTSQIATSATDPGDIDHYFSDRALHNALETQALERPSNCEVFAYNFPSWHTTPVMEKWFGKGWTEFETLRAAKPLFPGHQMPRTPLWGYFNEADPTWAAKEIDTAADYGLTGWMIDWYWHNGTQFYHEQLESGFLKASNRKRLKFAVMWANHQWKNVYPARSPDTAAVLLPQVHSIEDCGRVADYCSEHYFQESNYWRIAGRPVFAIFDLTLLISQLGADGTKRALEQMRKRVQLAGQGELHLQVSQTYSPATLKDFGIDSATSYHPFGWTYGGRPSGRRSPYGDGALVSIARWKELDTQSTVPYFPNVAVGWDDSSRFGLGSHVVFERTPDQFERLLRGAMHFTAKKSGYRAILVSSWNEWTEDHVLLPDAYFGYSYLEALRRAIVVR